MPAINTFRVTYVIKAIGEIHCRGVGVGPFHGLSTRRTSELVSGVYLWKHNSQLIRSEQLNTALNNVD